MKQKTVKIRPSDLLRFEACPKNYQLSKEGWWPLQPSANLAYGTAIHAAVETVVRGQVTEAADAGNVFMIEWDKQTASSPLKFGEKFDQASMRTMGIKMAEHFVEAWEKSGFQPVMTTDDKLLIEERMEVEVAPGVILSAQPDAIVWTRNGDLAVVDFKTAGSKSLPDFEVKSDQLTAYQIVQDAYADKFGTPSVGSLGFFEAIKRKTIHDWDAPRMTGRRSPERVKEYLDKVIWMADDIRKQRMSRRSLMAWNSPCKLCVLISVQN